MNMIAESSLRRFCSRDGIVDRYGMYVYIYFGADPTYGFTNNHKITKIVCGKPYKFTAVIGAKVVVIMAGVTFN